MTAKMGVMNTTVPTVIKTSFNVVIVFVSAASSSVMVGQTVVTRVMRVKGPAVVLLHTSTVAVMDFVLSPSESVMGTWTVGMGRMRGPAVS